MHFNVIVSESVVNEIQCVIKLQPSHHIIVMPVQNNTACFFYSAQLHNGIQKVHKEVYNFELLLSVETAIKSTETSSSDETQTECMHLIPTL